MENGNNTEKTIALGWIDSGDIKSGFAAYISQILLHRSNVVKNVIAASGPYLSNNRNRLVESFLSTECEWLFTLDSDVLVSLESFDALVEAADKDKYPIVGGKYFIPINGQVRVAAMVKNEDNPMLGTWIENLSTYIVDDLHSIGVGFAMIHRSVFEKIKDSEPNNPLPWFQDYWKNIYNENNQDTGGWISDDIHFFEKVNNLGINVALCLGATSTHVKDSLLNEESYLSFKKFKRYEDQSITHGYGFAENKRSIWRVFSKNSKA